MLDKKYLNNIDTEKFWNRFNIRPNLLRDPKNPKKSFILEGYSSRIKVSREGLKFYSFGSGSGSGGAYGLLIMLGYDKKEITRMLYLYKKENIIDTREIEEKLPSTPPTTKEKKFNKPFRNEKHLENRIINYLVNERKLSEKLAKWVFEKEYISVSRRKIFYDDNGVEKQAPYISLNFNAYDLNGVVEGQEVHGAIFEGERVPEIEIRAFPNGNFKYKMFYLNEYLFHLEFDKEIEKLYLFESGIDLLSYLELKGRTEKSQYVSLFGAAGHINMLDKFLNDNIKEIYICTDSDESGEYVYTKMKLLYENKYEILRIKPENKDWNDDLKLKNKIKEQKYDK